MGDRAPPALVVAALGVVFGDIGTSPIYTYRTVFNPGAPHPVPVTAENVYGIVSLVFWSVIVIVMITYVLLAMRADHDGEGGLLALLSQVRRWGARAGGMVIAALTGLGVLGAALFLGDSLITPAISVLAAVEGVEVIEPSLARLVVPVTAVIIVALFTLQHRGTGTVGRLFGPVMVVWFVTIGAVGARSIAENPGVLRALSPSYAIGFLVNHVEVAFFALAAVVLAVTGAEALYADMGHFGRRAITRAWLFLVFPACIASYLGQGALILHEPSRASSPFFLLAPDWGRAPLVVLATAATVIASQAVISGTYSVAAQAAQLGYLPRLNLTHTSESRIGQIYIPSVNWLLMVAVLGLVFAFRTSTGLAYAFGMAVTGTITITTLLFFAVARLRWRTSLWLLGVGATPLLLVDLLFFSANLTKLPQGAWIPIGVAVIAFTIMMTWRRGQAIVTAERRRREGSLGDFIARLRREPVGIVDGTAIYLNQGKETAPLALRTNVGHQHVRHQRLVIVSVEAEPVPRVQKDQAVAVDDLGPADDGIVHVTLRTGYRDEPNLPVMLSRLDPAITGGPAALDRATYFISHVELERTAASTMARWRKRLFIATSKATADPTDHYHLPPDRTVIVGARIGV
ncbi:MAG: KUP/HAK/KT family potassium transporter [Micromonosporaceae bacterium]|nr:KUP/HAK/KT family potassium transporter [Micromonosporaceae bacterium]